MNKAIYALGAAVAMIGASNAAAASPQAATGDAAKAKLEYVSTVTDRGTLRLKGTETSSQRRFDFRVARNGFVSGEIDGRPVSFWVPAEQRDRAVAAAVRRLAARAQVSDTAGTR